MNDFWLFWSQHVFLAWCALWLLWTPYLMCAGLVNLVNRVIRSRNIRAAGWPPPYLDADGDPKTADKDE